MQTILFVIGVIFLFFGVVDALWTYWTVVRIRQGAVRTWCLVSPFWWFVAALTAKVLSL